MDYPDLIIDLYQHCPSLHLVLEHSIYFTNNFNTTIWNKNIHDPTAFEQKYGFTFNDDMNDLLSRKYRNLFLIYPILDLDERHHPKNYQYCSKEFFGIYEKIIAKITGKIIIIDNHDYNINPAPYLKNIRYDFIFKRNYSRKVKYPENVHPYPFIDCCWVKDPMYNLLYNRQYSNDKVNRIFWAGSSYNHQDKKTLLSQIKHKLQSPNRRLSFPEFMDTIQKSTYSLSLVGCSLWGTRHFKQNNSITRIP